LLKRKNDNNNNNNNNNNKKTVRRGFRLRANVVARVEDFLEVLSREKENGETMGAEKVEQKVPPGIECGEYIENLSIHVGIQQQPKQQAPKY
jgi:hypothetical protein